MAAIYKSSLQNLSSLLTSLKVESLAKPKSSLKFFVNTTKPKTKVLAGFGQKLETKVCSSGLVCYWYMAKNEACKIFIAKA